MFHDYRKCNIPLLYAFRSPVFCKLIRFCTINIFFFIYLVSKKRKKMDQGGDKFFLKGGDFIKTLPGF